MGFFTPKKENVDKVYNIKVELVSRPNTMNGKYRTCQLEQLAESYVANIKNDNVRLAEKLQKLANLADVMIAEAEAQGKDTKDLNVMKELGKKIKEAWDN